MVRGAASGAALFERIHQTEPAINSLVHIDGDAARALDSMPDATPVVVKDNIAVAGAPWACGSLTRAGRQAVTDAAVVRSLRDAGAVIIGTSNMDEFAMGASTDTSAWGATRNPWDTSRSAGGSSGGSAASVSAYGVLAVGTDTGGSIREPASQCGVVGVKPTDGSISVDDLVPFAPSMDTVGPLAPDTAGAAWLHDVMAISGCTMSTAAENGGNERHIDATVGVVNEMAGDRNAPEIVSALERTLDQLASLGARVEPVSLPSMMMSLNTYYVLSSVEALPVLEEHARLGELGPEATHRLGQGRSFADTSDWRNALDARDRIRGDLNRLFDKCDLLLSPTMPLVAPPLTRKDLDDPLLIPRTDWWTVEANLAGIPAISIPCEYDARTGLPIGMQLMAPAHRDADLYYAAAALEAGTLHA